MKDYKGALHDYTKSIEINPKQNNAYYNRAVITIFKIMLLFKNLEDKISL